MSAVQANFTVMTEEKNPRGIPKAPFVTDVEQYIGGPEVEVELTLKQFQDALAKYRYMEANLSQRRTTLESKIPDIKKTLSMVEFLQERREGNGTVDDDLEEDVDDSSESSKKLLRTTFELNDTLYAEAELEDTDTVYLWLGANIMLEYKLLEANTLLSSKLKDAQSNLENVVEDLEFLREQTTIMEVNIARVYNWDVKRRRERRAREGETLKRAGADDEG